MPASLTGMFQTQGRQALEGLSAWIRNTNAAGGIYVAEYQRRFPLELVCYDDASKAQQAREITEKLITDDQVHLVFGPYSSVLTLASASVAQGLNRLVWNHGGASNRIHDQGQGWVVSILTPASMYFQGVIDLVREQDPCATKVAILHSSRGSFPCAVASGAEAYATEKGFQIVFREQYESPARDFSLFLDELGGLEADVFLGVGLLEDDLLLARQALQKGIRAPAFALVATPTRQFRQALGHQTEGFLGPSQWESSATYEPDYGPTAQALGLEDADYPLAQACAAGLVAQRCIEKAGTLDDAELRRAAGELDFTTFYGRFKLDPASGCQIGHSMVIIQWQGGHKKAVWPHNLRPTAD